MRPETRRLFAALVAAAMSDPELASEVAALYGSPATRRSPETVDVDGAAELLHLPATTIRQYAREGRLPGRKAGRRWVFFVEDVEAALRSNDLAA